MNSIRTVKAFVETINQHKTSDMNKWLDADFILVDAEGEELQGLDNNLEAWENYFSWFPDFKIEINSIFGDEHLVLAEGTVSGQYHGSSDPEDIFHQPASWRIDLPDNKIARWQVFADTWMIRKIIQRNHAAAPNPHTISGLGGVFFKAQNPKTLAAWYDSNLGTQFGSETYHTFRWRDHNRPDAIGRTEFSIFTAGSDYYDPSTKPFMINFRVNNLEQMLQKLLASGVEQVGAMEVFDYGKFAWILDPEGNKIELWEPVDQVLEDYDQKKQK